MKLAFSMIPAALIALAVSSCAPYPFDQPVPNQEQAPTVKEAKPVTYSQQKKAASERAAATAKAKTKAKLPPKPQYKAPTNSSSPKPQITKKNYQSGSKIPGKEGFIYSPYSGNKVDVRGLASGTKVRDPLDSDKTHIFLVP